MGSRMRKWSMWLMCVVFIACSAPPTATLAPPTATLVPPTATIVPPTATIVPTTATLVLPTAIPAPTACRERPHGTGKAPGSNELQPGGNRLRIARSDTLQTWTVDDAYLIEQAATPSLTMSASGNPLLYMTAHAINGKQDGFAVSVGDPTGQTWRHCYVELKGFPAGFLGVDPDVVRLADHQYRVYLTGGLRQGERTLGIHYADSTDGITWEYGGIAFAYTDSVIDSMTFKQGDTWHMYVLPMGGIDMIHATSSDGKTFGAEGQATRRIAKKPSVLSHASAATDGTPSTIILGFQPPGKGVYMAQTSDGTTLEAVPGITNPIIPVGNGDALFTRDPAMVALADSTAEQPSYLIVYATAIP